MLPVASCCMANVLFGLVHCTMLRPSLALGVCRRGGCFQQLCPTTALPPHHADYYTLLRFLRARNYELDKAMKMWLDTLEWRKEYDVDTILDNFAFHEREQFLMAYPQGYHKTDKLVSKQPQQHVSATELAEASTLASAGWQMCVHDAAICSSNPVPCGSKVHCSGSAVSQVAVIVLS